MLWQPCTVGRDLELQTILIFSNHGTVEWSAACFRHKTFYKKHDFFFFLITLYTNMRARLQNVMKQRCDYRTENTVKAII